MSLEPYGCILDLGILQLWPRQQKRSNAFWPMTHNGVWITKLLWRWNLFADEFDLLDKHYTTARYKSIINTHHLSSEKERLESELALFKQSKEYKLYWLERSRRKTQLNTYESCAEYVQDVVEQETTALTSTTPTSITTSLITVYNSSSSHGTPTSTAMSDTTIPISHITNTITDTIGTTDAAAAEYQELIFAATETVTDDVENTTPLEPWMFQGTNVAELFTKF